MDKQEKIKHSEETSSHVLNELKRDPGFKEVQNNNSKMNEIRSNFDHQNPQFYQDTPQTNLNIKSN